MGFFLTLYGTLRISTILDSFFTSFSPSKKEIWLPEMIPLLFRKRLIVLQKYLFVIIPLGLILVITLHAFLSSFDAFVTLLSIQLPI